MGFALQNWDDITPESRTVGVGAIGGGDSTFFTPGDDIVDDGGVRVLNAVNGPFRVGLGANWIIFHPNNSNDCYITSRVAAATLDLANFQITGGSGFLMGIDHTAGPLAKVFIGNAAAEYFEYNGSLFTLGKSGAERMTYDTANGLQIYDKDNNPYVKFPPAAAANISGWTIGATTLSSGSIYLDSSTPEIRLGAATDYMTGIGIWMGLHAAVYKIHLGNPAAEFLSWDGATLTVTGAIVAGSHIASTTNDTFEINVDNDDVNVQLILSRTTGGDATLQWNGTTVSLDKSFTPSGNIIMPDGGTIGQAAGPLLTFDDTNNYLEITGCKVGIGTATPNTILQVGTSGTTVNPNVRIASSLVAGSDISTLSFSFDGTTDNAGMRIDFSERNTTGLDIFADYPISFGNEAGARWMTIKAGNVGIGTVAPGARFHVVDNGTGVSAVARIASDDAVIYALVLGNDTFDSTLTRGLRFLIGDDGTAHIDAHGAGAENIAFQENGGNVSIGTTSPDMEHLYIYDNTVNTTTNYYSIRSYAIKTAGATTEADDLFGFHNYLGMNQNGVTIGYMIGFHNEVVLTDGLIGNDVENLEGMYNKVVINAGTVSNHMVGVTQHLDLNGGTITDDVRALWTKVELDGATVTQDVHGLYNHLALNSGTIGNDVFGAYVEVDLDAGLTSIGGDVYGAKIIVDDDQGAVGTVYGMYIECRTGVDYALIVDGGNVAIGTATIANAGGWGRILQIADDGSAAISVHDTASGKQFDIGVAANKFYMAYDADTGTHRMVVDTNGNVGISTSTPDARVESLYASGAQLRLTHTDSTHYADFTVGAAGDLTIAPTGDLIFNPTGNDVMPTTGYDLNLGSLTKKYLTIHAAELWVETLVAHDTMATIGGRIVVAPTTMLAADLGNGGGDTTITIEHNNLANGDTIWMESNGKLEFMLVTSAAGGAGPYTYTVTRNRDGSGLSLWYAGDAVVNTGAAGDGFIDIYSVTGIAQAGSEGPTIVGNVRDSNTYNDWDEHWAVGNLKGLYGYAATAYGCAFGEYSEDNYITIESTNGIRFFDATDTVQAQLTGTVWTLGVTATEHVSISATAIQFLDGATVYTDLTAGVLQLGHVAGGEYVEVSAANGIRMYANTSLTVQLTNAGVLTLGNTTNEHVYISSTVVQFKDGATVYGELTGTNWTLGETTNEHVAISTTAVQIKDGGTVYTELAAGTLILGDIANEHTRITAADGIEFKDGATIYGAFHTTVTLGDTGTEHVEITAAHVQFKDGATVYTDLTAGVLVLGSSVGGEYVDVSAANGIRMYGGGVQHVSIANTGTFWFGDTNATERLAWDAANGMRIYDGGNNAVLQFKPAGEVYLLAGRTMYIEDGGDILMEKGVTHSTLTFEMGVGAVTAIFESSHLGDNFSIRPNGDGDGTLLIGMTPAPANARWDHVHVLAENSIDLETYFDATHYSRVYAHAAAADASVTLSAKITNLRTVVFQGSATFASFRPEPSATASLGDASFYWHTLWLNDYAIVLGGIHVGGVADPGAGNIIATGGLNVTGNIVGGGGLSLTQTGNTFIEIRSTDGGTPFIDFSNDGAIDYDMRIILTNNSLMNIDGGGVTISGGALTISSGAVQHTSGALNMGNGSINMTLGSITVSNGIVTVSDYILAYGGIHIGGGADPGTDNLIVDGFVQTAGGVHVGGATDPGLNNLIVDGSMGVGIAPTVKCHIYGNTASGLVAHFQNDGNSTNRYGIGIACGMDTPDATWNHPIRIFDGNGGLVGYGRFNNTALAWSFVSDVSLKENIVDNKTMNGMNIIRALRVRDFEWIRSPGEVVTGFVAQEVGEVYPEAVSEVDGLKGYAMADLIIPMIKGIQEMDTTISAHEIEIINLKNQVVRHEERIAELEAEQQN